MSSTKKNGFTLTVITAVLLMAFAVPAYAAKSENKPNTDCLRAGQTVLRDLGLFQAATRGEIDYSALADAEEGPIFADLPEGSFLKISDVFKLHKSNPELFAWCAA